ncbi:hypothetical protein [Nocardia pseudobrasiliensis]|uniref:hypothetical protein n=1 Tax=Nocardia pseudobrasiliensis TaxID=45979 RepID=UPI0011C02872|nr:hypothetical protein [Nocardia pseudobrasiliensis]
MSESLMDLAARVKQVEEASAAAREKNRAALQARREALETTVEHEGSEFEKTAAELRVAARRWWSETREAIERQIGVMRGDFEKWQAEIKAQRATRTAKDDKTPAAAHSTRSAAEEQSDQSRSMQSPRDLQVISYTEEQP